MKEKKRLKNFPIKKTESEKWVKSKEIEVIIKKYTQGCLIDTKNLDPIFELIIFLMEYNYGIVEFYKNKINPVNMDYRDEELIKIFGTSTHWTKKETFLHGFEYFYPKLLTRLCLDGSILQEPYVTEELTGFDESFPQHYGFPSATLDWTYNPYISIYFGLEYEYHFDSKTGFYISSKMQCIANFLSIYAYRQIDVNEDSPIVKIEKPNFFKTNPRMERQQGLFTYFKKPCSFYLANRRFPSLEDYRKDCNEFEIIKFNLPRTEANLEYLKTLLKKHRIDSSYLLL